MKSATANDLRQTTAALLDEVRRGRTVVITYRGKSVAALTPVTSGRKGLNPIGFGINHSRIVDRRSRGILRGHLLERIEYSGVGACSGVARCKAPQGNPHSWTGS